MIPGQCLWQGENFSQISQFGELARAGLEGLLILLPLVYSTILHFHFPLCKAGKIASCFARPQCDLTRQTLNYTVGFLSSSAVHGSEEKASQSLLLACSDSSARMQILLCESFWDLGLHKLVLGNSLQLVQSPHSHGHFQSLTQNSVVIPHAIISFTYQAMGFSRSVPSICAKHQRAITG